jgi:hypothetical protein
VPGRDSGVRGRISGGTFATAFEMSIGRHASGAPGTRATSSADAGSLTATGGVAGGVALAAWLQLPGVRTCVEAAWAIRARRRDPDACKARVRVLRAALVPRLVRRYAGYWQYC